MKRRRESSASNDDDGNSAAEESRVAEEDAAGGNSGTENNRDDEDDASAAAILSVDAEVNIDVGPSSPNTTEGNSLPVAPYLTDFGNHPTDFQPQWEWYAAPTRLPQQGVAMSVPATNASMAGPELTWVLPDCALEVVESYECIAPTPTRTRTRTRVVPSKVVLTRPQTLFGRDWDTALHMCIREIKVDAALILIEHYCAPGILALIDPGSNWTRRPLPADHVPAVATTTTTVPTPSPGTATAENSRVSSPTQGWLPSSPASPTMRRCPPTEDVFACSIDVPNAHGVTPLMVAAQRGNIFVARALLRQGSDPSRQSSNGDTAAIKASHFGHIHVLRELVTAWKECRKSSPGEMASTIPQFLQVSNARGTSPLMRAAQEGHRDVVQYLLNQGVNVDQRNLHKMTALLLAAQRGHTALCELLLQHGANYHATNDPQNSTALQLACRRGHTDVVRVLVQAGATQCHRDARGRTAEHFVRREGILQERDRSTLLRLLDPQYQVYLWQVEARKQRNWNLCRLWHLLQQERAHCRAGDELDEDDEDDDDNDDDDDEEEEEEEGEFNDNATVGETSESSSTPGVETFTSASIPRPDEVSIHHVQQYLDAVPGSWPMSMDRPLDQSAIVGCYFQSTTPSRKALLRTLSMLPAPLVQLVAEFLPLPHLWGRRLEHLSRASLVNPMAALLATLDLIDEALEEIGLVEVFAAARVSPPRDFASWAAWKRHVRLHGDISASRSCRPPPEDGSVVAAMTLPPRLDVTTAEVQLPGNPQAPCAIELRRTVGYLALVARYPDVQEILIGPPWCMESNLVTRLSTVSDLSQLMRRTMPIAADASDGPGPFDALAVGGDNYNSSNNAIGGISVNPPVALDVIMLASQLCNWYESERWLRPGPLCLGHSK